MSTPSTHAKYGTLIPAAPNAAVTVIEIAANENKGEPMTVTFSEASTRLVVVAGKNAKCVVVETLTGSGARTHAVEIFVDEGASVEFVSIQNIDPSASITITQRSSVGANASIQWKNATLGGASVSHDLDSTLTGAHAESSIDWLFYARHADTHTLTAQNTFGANHGGGEIVMKGVAEEKAHVKCDGMIAIGPNGTHTDTYLTQEVLMLDPTSRVDAIPGLEIKTNDVKASHSATVSRVTDEDLFYFAARGIKNLEARKMFVEGFLEDLLANLSSQNARDEISALVEGKYAVGR
jgi:Fe-S cluster assembly protein SufB/Fe-S cluster assembly protein SufD